MRYFLHSVPYLLLKSFQWVEENFFCSRIFRLWLPGRKKRFLRLILFLACAHKNQSSTGTFYCRQFHVNENAYINFPRESHQTVRGSILVNSFLMASHIVAALYFGEKKNYWTFILFRRLMCETRRSSVQRACAPHLQLTMMSMVKAIFSTS